MSSTLQRLSVPIVWAITIVVFGILRPASFLTVPTFASILGSDAVLVFLTLGLVITLRAGDYDLSIAAILTLSAMVLTVLNVNHHMSVWVCLLIALGAGAGVGAVNGVITVYVGVDSFIATLGVGTFVSGVVLWISSGTTYSGVSQTLIDLVVGKTFFKSASRVLLCTRSLRGPLVRVRVHGYRPAATFRGQRQRGRTVEWHLGQSRPFLVIRCHWDCCGGGRCSVRRYSRGRGSRLWADLSSSGVRRGVSRINDDQAGRVQSHWSLGVGLLSRHGYHRTADFGCSELRDRSLLRRGAHRCRGSYLALQEEIALEETCRR